MFFINEIRDKILPYIEDEKENYNRSLKYMKRCSILSASLLSILFVLFMYVNLYYRPTHAIHATSALIHEAAAAPKIPFKSKLMAPLYHNANDLNPDLFCSLKTDENGNIKNKTHSAFLTKLIALQNPHNCFDERNQYFILHHQCNVGLFSSIQCLSYYFLMSIFMNRTFIVTGDWSFGTEPFCMKYGALKYENSMQCFFLPISSCSSQQILDDEQSKQSPSIFTMTVDSIQERENQTGLKINKQWFYSPPNQTIPGLNDRILIMPSKDSGGFGWRYFHKSSMLKSIEFWLHHIYGMNRYDFSALITSYLMRMKDKFKKNVYRTVLQQLPNLDAFNTNESVSILAGAGCKRRTTHNWMCFEYNEYMDLVKELKRIQPHLRYVIVTGTNVEMIRKMNKHYDKWMQQNDMMFIGLIGNVLSTKSAKDALVTMQLQFASQYHIASRLDGWALEFLTMLQRLECTLFNKINDMDFKRWISNNTLIYLDGNNESHNVVWDSLTLSKELTFV